MVKKEIKITLNEDDIKNIVCGTYNIDKAKSTVSISRIENDRSGGFTTTIIVTGKPKK